MKVNYASCYLIIAITLLSFSFCQQQCGSANPNSDVDCTSNSKEDKQCCLVQKGTEKTCKEITGTTNKQLMTEIKKFDSNYVYCGNKTEIEKCYNIINPTEKLACTGRKVEDSFSCCFMKMGKTKRCYPLEEGTNKTFIDDFAEKFKTLYGLDDIPSVECNSNILQTYFVMLTLFLVLI